MDSAFQNIRAVGFDLDGTLYAQTPQMDERIRDLIATKVLAKLPELGSLEKAREFSERKYRELESRKKTLEVIGYENASKLMEEIFHEADGAQFLERDARLIALLEEIRKAKEYLYLITTSPEKEAKKKLEKLGVSENLFNSTIFGDNPIMAENPKNEIVFGHIVKLSGIPAENHVYIGDREKADILSPQSIGMKTIAVGTEIPAADMRVPLIYDIQHIIL